MDIYFMKEERTRPTFNNTDLPRLKLIKFSRTANGKKEIVTKWRADRRQQEERVTQPQLDEYFDNMTPDGTSDFSGLPKLRKFRFGWTPDGEKEIVVKGRCDGGKLTERVTQTRLDEYFENI
jgi:hypothetical protein